MPMPLRIYLADLAHDYLPGHYVIPLNIGYLSAYLQHNFGKQVDVRLFKSPRVLLDSIRQGPAPHVMGFSNYSWNQELNRAMIKRLRAEFPDTVVCSGGPHIRTDDPGVAAYLSEHRDVDYYCMVEGEVPFGHLIEHFLSSKPVRASYCGQELPGMAYLTDDQLVYPRVGFEKGTIENIPSPILTGVLDDFIGSSQWVPLLETNRGCPYHCTFCVWGISAMDKVRVFPLDRVLEEIRFMGKRSPSGYWIFADANFGMLKRDLDIAREIRRVADKHGVLRTALLFWAKNSSHYTVEIAQTLGHLSDPLAAVQTMDETVLKNIKRDNIKLTTMTDLLEQFHRDGLKASTDVLVGLPGESLDRHLDTLRRVYKLGFDRINVGAIRLLPGSEMESNETRADYDLQTKYRLISGNYGIYEGEGVFEYEESVRASKDISEDEMHSTRVIHFFVWALSNLGVAHPLLRWLQLEHGLNPIDAILSLSTLGKDTALDKFLLDFDEEARGEWFDSPEDLVAYYTAHFDQLIADGFLKMTSKYLAKIILDKGFARTLLTVISSEVDSPIAAELAEFCFDRIYFLDNAVQQKECSYSDELIAALKKVFPHLPFESSICRFGIEDGVKSYIDHELKRFEFANDPPRGLALTLESCYRHFLYDFEFGQTGTKEEVGELAGSFDYDTQLGGPGAESKAKSLIKVL